MSGWLSDAELKDLDARYRDETPPARGVAGLGDLLATLVLFQRVYPQLADELRASRSQLPVLQENCARYAATIETQKKEIAILETKLAGLEAQLVAA
jgi:hypothetical protein